MRMSSLLSPTLRPAGPLDENPCAAAVSSCARLHASLRLQRALGAKARIGHITPLAHPDWAEAEAALRDGADIDARILGGGSETILMNSCVRGHLDVVRWLLAHGADPEAVDARGWTALVCAVWEGRMEIVAALLAHGVDPRCLDAPLPGRNGETLLMQTCARGLTRMALWLLDRGGRLERKDARGLTALAHAVRGGRGEVIAGLLTRGADPNARDRGGRSIWLHALDRAADPALLDLFLDHGADPARIDSSGRVDTTVFEVVETGSLLDAALAQPKRAILRRRLLEQLTPAQRIAWLPRSCAAETAGTTRSWTRRA